jgi:signal transduction histidine kinase
MTGISEYPQILDVVAHAAVPALADACVVSIAEERPGAGPRFVPLGVPEIDHRARQVLAEDAVHLPVLLEVLRSGQPQVFPSLPATDAPDLIQPAYRLELGASSFMTIPLRVRGRIIGAVTLFRILNPNTYDAFDLATAEDFSRRAGLSIETSRLYHYAHESARVRGEFLSLAAHELRTPVTPIKMQTQSLLHDLGDNGNGAVKNLTKRLESIERATGRLESLIDSLLDVSELTVGEFTPDLTDTDLSDLAHDVACRLASDLEKAGCSLTLTAPDAVVGQWDRPRIRRVVSSLVSNATKYGSGKPIEMTVRKHHANARLTVRDHGIGIPRSEQARVFDLFERAVPVHEYGGLGLGLWIARQVIEAHGGHIFLWSRPGEGSEFTVELPLRPSGRRLSSATVPAVNGARG